MSRNLGGRCILIWSAVILSHDLQFQLLNSSSTASNPSKNPLNSMTPSPGSLLPIVALMLCMLNCGSPRNALATTTDSSMMTKAAGNVKCKPADYLPASIARIPIFELNIGPTVPPDRLSLRIWKTCSCCPHLFAILCKNAVLTASVVVCPSGSA